MGSLVAAIQDRSRREAIVQDCVTLIEAEVSDKRGLTGMAIKTAYKTVKGLRPGMIPMAMNHLLDDFSRQVDPFWQECQSTGADPKPFFVQRKGEIADALLAITDGRAERADNRILVGAYKRLRPKAVDHIGDAMPRLAALFVKHAS